MKPHILKRIQEQIQRLEETLGLLSLGCNISDIEMKEIESCIDLLKEIEEIFK